MENDTSVPLSGNARIRSGLTGRPFQLAACQQMHVQMGNSFPGVICGHVEDPVDAYTFAHVNDGNAVAMPFAKGFGWGGELNLEYCFEKLFGFGHGQGYPKERVEPEQRNKKILDGVRAATFKPLIECLKSIDQDLLKGAIAGEKFRELFFASCKDEELAAYVKSLLV